MPSPNNNSIGGNVLGRGFGYAPSPVTTGVAFTQPLLVTATQTLNVPPQAVAALVFLVSGGGAGGGVANVASSFAGGGPMGGYGAVRIDINKMRQDNIAVTTATCTIGSGGTGVSASTGGAGGNTSIAVGSLTLTAYAATAGGNGASGSNASGVKGGIFGVDPAGGSAGYGVSWDGTCGYVRVIPLVANWNTSGGNPAMYYGVNTTSSGTNAGMIAAGGTEYHATFSGAGNSGSTPANQNSILLPQWVTNAGLAFGTMPTSSTTKGGSGSPSFGAAAAAATVQQSGSTAGTNASGYGGGGAGAVCGSSTQANQPGGNGAPGAIVLVWELFA